MMDSTQSLRDPSPGSRKLNRTPFKTNYLPGYTGHIPYKKEIYGCTIGDINKIVMGRPTLKASNFDADEAVAIQNGTFKKPPLGDGYRTLYSSKPISDDASLALQYGNTSRNGNNWIGGPTNIEKAQHVPGYQGYVPSIKSENLYGKTFSKQTSIAINKEFPNDPGQGRPPLGQGVSRYKTSNNSDFSKDNFRRIVNATVEPADIKDNTDTYYHNDEEFLGIHIAQPDIYQTIQTVGYQGFNSQYRVPAVTMFNRKQPQFNINALKSRMPPLSNTNLSSLASSKQHFNQSDGFRKSMSTTIAQNTPENKSKIPILGYTGHRMGQKAQGFFGKNFREITIESRNLQKTFGSQTSSYSKLEF